MLGIAGILGIFLLISVIAGVVLAYLGAQITDFWESIFGLVNVLAAILIGYTGGAYLVRSSNDRNQEPPQPVQPIQTKLPEPPEDPEPYGTRNP